MISARRARYPKRDIPVRLRRDVLRRRRGKRKRDVSLRRPPRQTNVLRTYARELEALQNVCDALGGVSDATAISIIAEVGARLGLTVTRARKKKVTR